MNPRPPSPRPAHLRTRYKKIRIHYQVERLPDPVRALIDRGLGEGKTYRELQAEVRRAGHRISLNALSHYWRGHWRKEDRRLRWIREQSEALASALRHTGETNEALLARKLLFNALFDRMQKDLSTAKFVELLRETRQLYKSTQERDSAVPPPLSPEEMRERIHQIYGWPEEKPESETPSGS